jgi:secondary thiamine-phosphate synthase enzyme
MSAHPIPHEAVFTVYDDVVSLRTEKRVQFVDLTDLVAERVRRSGVVFGLASVQVHHTTAALVVNEDEPLLLDDARRLLERVAPSDVCYGHDDFSRRATPEPEERPNGAAHCRSLLLGASQTLHVRSGALQLGRWQRLFLVELDGPRPRRFSILVLGARG